MKFKYGILLNTFFSIFLTILVSIAILRYPSFRSEYGLIDHRLLLLTGVLASIVSGLVLFSAREIFKKINILNDWTETILKGDFDQMVDFVSSDDEIGRLSQSLGHVLRNIESAYASMHKESEDHKQQSVKFKKLSEASQSGVRHLSKALTQMKDSQKTALQAERLKTIEQTTRSIVHDISESIVPIFSTTEILLEHSDRIKDADEIRSSVEIIHEAVWKTRKNIRLLADFFGTAPLGRARVDVNSVVQQAIKLVGKYTSDAHGAPVSVESHLDLDLPPIGGNAIELQDSLVNLLINAIEAMPKGGTITVSSHVIGETVKVSCEDTGTGMSEDVRNHCVEPFYTTKQKVGAGLGLTNVYVVAQRYGGNLEIESFPGSGTRIDMSFPVWREQSVQNAEIPVYAKADRVSLDILVTDDDPMTNACIVRILEVKGFKVDTAATAAEGLDKIKRGNFNFAIIDRAMAGMSGEEMALQIKEFDRRMPVLMLTGYGDIINKEGGFPPCVDLVIAKPVSGDELYDAISKTLCLQAKNAERNSGESGITDSGDIDWIG